MIERWQCHKQVNAAKIKAIEFNQDGLAKIAIGNDKTAYVNNYRERFKGNESDLGYYVIYDDGYTSWSPTKAFEEGYTLVDKHKPNSVTYEKVSDERPNTETHTFKE